MKQTNLVIFQKSQVFPVHVGKNQKSQSKDRSISPITSGLESGYKALWKIVRLFKENHKYAFKGASFEWNNCSFFF